jgi:hypothetical protein
MPPGIVIGNIGLANGFVGNCLDTSDAMFTGDSGAPERVA